MTANDRLFDLTLRGHLYFEQVANDEVAKLIELVEGQTRPRIQALLDRELARLDRSPSPFKTKRYRELLRNLDNIMDTAGKDFGQVLLSRMDAVAQAAAAQGASYLSQAIPITMTWNVPSPALLREIVRARPYDGELLKDWAASISNASKKSIRRVLNTGMTAGEGLDVITRRIMGDSVASRAFKGSETMKAQRRNIRSVVRTMANGIANGAREATFQANPEVLRGVQWLSTLDIRTTDICQSLDGQQFSLTAGPRPPAHHQCRSTVVPVTKSWRELGIKAGDKRLGGRAFRDVKTGLSGVLPTRPTYPQWLRKQTKETQIQVLGKTRAQLWRGNRIKFSDLYKNNRRLTLEELAEREGLNL